MAEKIGKSFNKNKVRIGYAMNYGSPSINNVMKNMFSDGCTKILVVPLYPQYSATTTASVVDKVNKTLQKMRWQPTIRFCPPYFDDKIYIEAIVKQIKQSMKKSKSQKILASFANNI